MPDLPIKKREDRAKRKARQDLEALGFRVVNSDNRPICLVAIDPEGSGVRLIRVCLDKVRQEDRAAFSSYEGIPAEIWFRRIGSERFERLKL